MTVDEYVILYLLKKGLDVKICEEILEFAHKTSGQDQIPYIDPETWKEEIGGFSEGRKLDFESSVDILALKWSERYSTAVGRIIKYVILKRFTPIRKKEGESTC